MWTCVAVLSRVLNFPDKVREGKVLLMKGVLHYSESQKAIESIMDLVLNL